MPRKGRLIIGSVLKPHGVRGEVKINSHLVGHLEIERVKEATLVLSEGPPQKRRITSARRGTKGWIVKFEGIDTPEDVEKLRTARIEVDSRYLPAAEAGEYYHADLVGMEVRTVGNETVGEVKSVIPRGDQDLLVIEAGGREVFIPAIEPIVVEIDAEKKLILIDPPEGLIE